MEKNPKKSISTLNERIKKIRQEPVDSKLIEKFNRMQRENERVERESGGNQTTPK